VTVILRTGAGSEDGVKFGMIWSARPTLTMIGVAGIVLATASNALAADVNVTSDVTTGVNLDTYAGSTARVFPGVTVNNALGNGISATIHAWTVTNDGTVGGRIRFP
jgi:hypothetical protein